MKTVIILSLFVKIVRSVNDPPCTPPFQRCPDDFETNDKLEICYTLTKPTTFPPECPYKDTLPWDTYHGILNNYKNESIWLPVRRDRSNNGLGFIVWVESSNKFGSKYESSYSIRNDDAINHQDCVVYHNESLKELVSCSQEFKAVCAYPYFGNVADRNKLCSNNDDEVNDINCRQSKFDTKSPCFCTGSLNNFPDNGTDEQFVRAEFIESYQNHLYQDLTRDDCLIGLERLNGHKFIWSKSRCELNYNGFWHFNPTALSDDEFIATSCKGFKILNASTPCFIYEKPPNNHTPSMELEVIGDDFVVTINQPQTLKWIDGHILFFCFTNSYTLWYRYEPLKEMPSNPHQIKYTFLPATKGPGYYWCSSFAYPEMNVIQTPLILYRNSYRYGLEFVGLFEYHYVKGSSILSSSTLAGIDNAFSLKLERQYYARIMKIVGLDADKGVLYLNSHFTVNNSNSDHSDDIYVEFDKIKKLLENDQSLVNMSLELLSLVSADYCLDEITITNGKHLTWALTKLGHVAHPREFCFTDFGTRLTRSCEGNFVDGASWSVVNESCTVQQSHSRITSILIDALLNFNDPPSNNVIIDIILNVSKDHIDFVPIDVYLIAELLDRIKSDTDTSLDSLSKILSNLQLVDTEVLKESQQSMNATNLILDSVDCIVANHENIDHARVQSSNTLIVLSTLAKTKLFGLILHLDQSVTELTATVDDFNDYDNIDSAVILSPELFAQFKKDDRLNLIVYFTNSLFNCEGDHPKSKIFGVQVPEIGKFLGPISILYNSTTHHYSSNDGDCVFWNFGNQSESFWFKETKTLNSSTSSLTQCNFEHTTNFAMLITDKSIDDDFHLLDLITHINCGLSAVGLCCILLTGILFKRWRLNTGNQILVNFSLAISIQIISFYLSNTVFIDTTKSDTTFCTIIGMVLHYSIVSQFGWMFVIAVLQFRRFVDVLSGPPKYVLLKACICGWILPFFPVLTVWFLDRNNYVSGKVGLCYPSGNGLYLGIWLPIAVIVAINFVIFIYIIYNVVHRRTEAAVDTINTEILFQVRLAILLFFMLGLTWTFGFLSEWDFGRIFTYIFCFTATLQGFVMFTFFIVFNQNTRSMYVHGVKSLCGQSKFH